MKTTTFIINLCIIGICLGFLAMAEVNGQIIFSDDFEDGDVSDWTGGYYSGRADLGGKQSGAPSITATEYAAASGDFGLQFTREAGFGNTAIVSSPELGSLATTFQMDFDIIPGERWHHFFVGELPPHLTYDETRTVMFGINLGMSGGIGYVSLYAQNHPRIGYYTPNTFYHVTFIAEPTTSRFDITITGALRDMDNNPVHSITVTDVTFVRPVSSGGALRYINLWQNYRHAIGTMGLDNVVVKEPGTLNNPPVADAELPETVEANTIGGADVQLDGSGSRDADGDELTYQWTWDGGSAEGVNPIVFLPLGTTTVTLVVNDGSVDSEPHSVDIEVVDTTPPVIALNTPSPSVLWPPNHKFVDVSVTGIALDVCCLALLLDVNIEVIDSEGGDGGNRHDADYEIIYATIDEDGCIDILVSLRAERSGKGGDRIYAIVVTVTDDSDKSATDVAQVLVPHDGGKGKKK